MKRENFVNSTILSTASHVKPVWKRDKEKNELIGWVHGWYCRIFLQISMQPGHSRYVFICQWPGSKGLYALRNYKDYSDGYYKSVDNPKENQRTYISEATAKQACIAWCKKHPGQYN